MRTLTETSSDLAKRPTLYRIWVPLHDDEEVPLASIWIDPALTAFESCARVGTTTNFLEGQKKVSMDRFDAEDLNSILPRRN